MCWISAHNCINLNLSSSVFIYLCTCFQKIKINYALQRPTNAASRSMSLAGLLLEKEKQNYS